MNISENLKRLRRNADATQEDVAQFLNCSPQAISKWERGEGYPEITLLPMLASYFGVTVDTLLGVDDAKKAAELKDFRERYTLLKSKGELEEAIALSRETLKKYPDDWATVNDLAYALHFLSLARSEAERKKLLGEAIPLYERVLKFSTDGKLRNSAERSLMLSYPLIGETEKARAIAENLPDIWFSREILYAPFIEDSAERFAYKQKSLHTIVTLLNRQIMDQASLLFLSMDALPEKFPELRTNNMPGGAERCRTLPELIEITRTAIAVIDLICGGKDGGFFNYNQQNNHFHLLSLLLLTYDDDAALDALEKTAQHAIAYDEYKAAPPETLHDALLFDHVEYRNDQIETNATQNQAFSLLQQLRRNTFDGTDEGIRETERYKAVIALLEAHAK